MSKYVLCSPENSGVLTIALTTNPAYATGGRQAYLMSRAGTIVHTMEIRFKNVGVTITGRTPPLTAEDTEQEWVVVTVEGRDDIVKWKLGLFSSVEHMSVEQKVLHEHIDHCDGEQNLEYDPPGFLPDWAN